VFCFLQDDVFQAGPRLASRAGRYSLITLSNILDHAHVAQPTPADSQEALRSLVGSCLEDNGVVMLRSNGVLERLVDAPSPRALLTGAGLQVDEQLTAAAAACERSIMFGCRDGGVVVGRA
jgi:hypothetical protein